jgi:uncharacterized protein YecT (DUF1311 family)
MTPRRALAAALLLVLPTVAMAQSQRQMDADACAQAKAADAELNRVYKDVVARLAKDAKLGDRLKTAQRAWVAFRDAQLTLLWPGDDPGQGSVAPTCACGASQELTEERTKQLKRMLAGEEGDVCSWQRP